MFNTKNPTPRQLSAFTAFIISVPVAIGIYILHPEWQVGIGAFILVFLGSYALISLTLHRFIYRKLKLIYKYIYQTKASKREEMYYKYIIPQKGIDEVRLEVEKWGDQRRREIEVLQQNEHYRKEFLQNLAHEFKTPVFAIQGYVDTLLSGASEDPEVSKKFLRNASKNVDRLVNLMLDLDEISKLERGEQKLNKERFIIQDLMKEVYETLSIKANKKKMTWSIKKGCEVPLAVYADKEKIRQVLINLIENAAKYGKIGGSVIASMYNTDDKHILIEISDDGIGIESEHLTRIFERFYRTDIARSRNSGGTGIGLAICKHIVEAHDQTIHVRSTVDVGTTIGFTLEKAR